ncbi:MAG: hypothetical protein FWD83_05885 [Promicromonosporaceae bacterium]|nr:hypothetical protein [Promicromonosporaceae bacterium]
MTIEAIRPVATALERDSDTLTGLHTVSTETHTARDATHFRRIIAARQACADADAGLRAAVESAREAGDSWTIIGAALDTTRQAAFQRFGQARAAG